LRRARRAGSFSAVKLLVTEAAANLGFRRQRSEAMRASRSHTHFDHGAALRVPPPHDAKNWRTLWMWLGEDAHLMAEVGAVQVRTPEGPVVAHCGDWIVLSHSGAFHVAHTTRTCDA
jgi:hypothetical protein